MNTQKCKSKFVEFKYFVSLEKLDITCLTKTWVSEGFKGVGFWTLQLEDVICFPIVVTQHAGGFWYM